jgi:hypothetical protein
LVNVVNNTKDPVTELGKSLKNLFCNSEDLVLTSMKRDRRWRKNVARRQDETKKQVKTESDTNTIAASILSNRELFSNVSTDDYGRAISTHRQRKHDKTVRFFGSNTRNHVTLHGAETSPSAFHGAGVEVEDQSTPVPPNFTTQAGELKRGTIEIEAQDEQQSYEEEEMDVEMSGRIAKLEV